MKALLLACIVTSSALSQTPEPALSIETFPPAVVDAARPFALRVYYANRAQTTAPDVRIRIDIPGIESVIEAPANCAISGHQIQCDVGDLPPATTFAELDLVVMAPDVSAKRLPVSASITGVESSHSVERETTTFRTFFVTTTADDGSGSLRQAMHDANAACRSATPPCKIAFRIPNGNANWLTLRPESPLPLTTVNVAIDGAMQGAYIGDSNPDGPEIEISGARVREGSGLQSSEACLTARGLIINGFPESGIHLGGSACGEDQIVEDNYIGTDPTGTRAIPNQRGITSTAAWGNDPSPIRGNLISGNSRSGIFVESGELRISNNVIGLTRGAKAALGNGASGVYLGPESVGTDVVDNYIGFNHHFGISLDRRARYSAFRGNSFQANWNLAIDFGLDGPTAAVPDASASELPVNRPVVALALYDAQANQTLIQGSAETHPDRHQVWVDVYANDAPDESGYGEGQYFLGTTMADREGVFRLTFAGRPPGPWIAATTTRLNIIGFAKAPVPHAIHGSGLVSTTSEFSRTLLVRE